MTCLQRYSLDSTFIFLVICGSIGLSAQQSGGDPPTFSDPDTLKRAFKAWPASHSVKLKCKAMGAAPLKYTWLKDGKILRGRKLDPYLNTSIWYLKLKDLRPGDAGEYTCIVSNPYGSINHTYSVRVLAKPRTIPILWKDLPRNKSAQVGESVTMKCLVVLSGTLPDLRWLKWDKSITFVSNIRDNLEDGAFQLIDPQYYSTIRQGGESYGSELKISNVTEEDFGLYTCYASNHIGAEYNSAFLNRYVRPTKALPGDRGDPPTFSDPDTLKRAFKAWPASHSVKLKCKAMGAAPLKYTWLKDGKILRGRKLDPYLNTSIWYLKLKDLVPGDAGEYTCIVSNPYGSINHTYSVRVQDNPLDPKDTGSESDDPVIMDKVSWILLGVSLAVFVAMVTASAWLCMKMWKLKMSSRANARGSRRDIASLRPRYDVQNEYVVVPNFK